MKCRPLVSGAAAAVLLSGCGSTTIIKTVSDSAATRTATTQPPSTSAATVAPAPQTLRVGDGVTVGTSETKLRITVTSILDPLPVGEFDEPDSGNRFVGVAVAVRNVGDAPYADAPANGSTLILRDDTQASSTTVSGGPCGNGFDADIKLAPGDRRAGCIAFEVPQGKRLRSFQFTGDSGFADDTAQWQLPSGSLRVATPAAGAQPTGIAWRSCDTNISVGANTTCPFAENVFYEYYTNGGAASITAFSPALGVSLDTTCSQGDPIVCTTADGGSVRFSQAAIDAYSPSQAAHYAATHATGT